MHELHRSRLLWLVVVMLFAWGYAHAQQAPTKDDTHGAAAMEPQQAALAKLGLKLSPDMPASVDPQAFSAALPADNEMTAPRVALGQKLYFEKALSKDGTVACATCHDVTRSFTDRRPVSEGVGDALGRRNAPTTMNAVFLHAQFWDGRAGSLEEQAGQPILNPVEMALPSREDAVSRLKNAGYSAQFQQVFARDIEYEDIERAIAAFERTLIFLDAPFDRYLAGDLKAISPAAQAGMALFNGKARCVTCHAINAENPLGTDNRFHNIGVSARTQNFEGLATEALAALARDPSEQTLDQLAVGTNLSELGRFMVTKNYADIGSFRTPQLRNVGITAPYMHDGSMQTLWDVMDHYNKGGEVNSYLDGGIEALALTEEEIDQLVAFMFALTDVRFAELNSEELKAQQSRAQSKRPFRDNTLAQRTNLAFGSRVSDNNQAQAKP